MFFYGVMRYFFLILPFLCLVACGNKTAEPIEPHVTDSVTASTDSLAAVSDSVDSDTAKFDFEDPEKMAYMEGLIRDSLAKISADAYFKRVEFETSFCNPRYFPLKRFGKFEDLHFKEPGGSECYFWLCDCKKFGKYYVIFFAEDCADCTNQLYFYVVDDHFQVLDKAEYEVIYCLPDGDEEDDGPSFETVRQYKYYDASNHDEQYELTNEGVNVYTASRYFITDTLKHIDYECYMNDTLATWGVNDKGRFYVKHTEKFKFNADTMLANMSLIKKVE